MLKEEKIEIKYVSEKGWVFHAMDEINDLLDEYGIGSLIIENDKLYFSYWTGDNIEEFISKSLGEPIQNDESDIVWICSAWVPMSFNVVWNKKEKYGLGYGDFKFKSIKDFNIYTKEFFKYKRQNKKNIEKKKELNVDWATFMGHMIAKFALAYCDYTEEEIKIIKKYWDIKEDN